MKLLQILYIFTYDMGYLFYRYDFLIDRHVILYFFFF